ncbi:hypothetical protein Cantr_08522 [Candida viswanathii]|uniref:THO complex subunit HPR1 n=1 Tax=Candida viswanathii TaxID=5486 RepID=A0A367Y4C7_9ASCO|nr:hypothetical protein Cantr_08522 [Candida viswanathii]
MVVNPKVAKSILSLSKIIESVVDNHSKNSAKDYVAEVTDDSIFTDGNAQIQGALSKIESDYRLEVTEELPEAQKAEVEDYNKTIGTNLEEFVLSSAFRSVIQSRIEEFLQNEDSSSAELYNSLALILDFELSYAINISSETKNVFYESWDQVTKLLSSISTPIIEGFWGYFEARLPVIMNKIFENTTMERIKLLYTFNYLTDRFDIKNDDDKRDSYKKDSFNDTFEARVRFLAANILAFEDNTGLNKYFLRSDRTAPSLVVDDPFLTDMMDIQKLLRDPLSYTKADNHKKLRSLGEKCNKVVNQIIMEEQKFRSEFPLDDESWILPPRPEEEQEYLREKYSKLTYVPETYFTSLFKGKEDKLQAGDKELLDAILSQSNTRMQYLVMIFIAANVISELLPKIKQNFMTSLHAPLNVKHFIQDSITEGIERLFGHLKRDIPLLASQHNRPFTALLQHVLHSEREWWRWLLYGKDYKTGKLLLLDRDTSSEELQKVADDLEKIYRYKDSRYFNTYVTPQVTRKMKAQRGLSQMNSVENFPVDDVKRNVEDIEDEISNTEDSSTKHELLEKKSLLSWRLLRNERLNNWFESAQQFREEMLSHQEEIQLDEGEDDEDEEMPEETTTEQKEDTDSQKRQLDDGEKEEEANGHKKPKVDTDTEELSAQEGAEPGADPTPEIETEEVQPEVEESVEVVKEVEIDNGEAVETVIEEDKAVEAAST